MASTKDIAKLFKEMALAAEFLLDFDSVVLTGFEETGDRDAGLRSLYVAATRATQELILVVDEHAPRWISDVVGFAGGVGE
jgi:ATP-dependent exoDNAse (exonuclease V) beta subunit